MENSSKPGIFSAVKSALAGSYRVLCTVFLGRGDYPSPPVSLAAVWVVITIMRLYPGAKSLWEDEIWMLILSVHQQWSVTAGFVDFNSGNHILYSILSKLLIEFTHHHWIEFVYRIPSEAAAFLTLPIGYAVFSRYVSPLGGTLSTLIFSFLPFFTYHAANSRGYSLWCFITVLLLGVLPGAQKIIRPVRMAIAYLCLATTHSLAFIPLSAFAVFGCWTGVVRHRMRVFFVNLLLALPGFVFCLSAFPYILSYDHSLARPPLAHWYSIFAFMPTVGEVIFGSSLFPGYSIIWVALIVFGLVIIFRKSVLTGISVLACGGNILFAAIITQNPFGVFERIYMGALPFVILAIVTGVQFMVSQLEKSGGPIRRHANSIAIAAMCFLFIPWIPSLVSQITLPKQDYRTLFEDHTREFRDSKGLFGATSYYVMGLSYYARRFNIGYTPLETIKEIRDSIILSDESGRRLVVASRIELPDSIRKYIDDSLFLCRTFLCIRATMCW